MIKDTYMLGVFPVTGCQSKTILLLLCLRKFWELTWTPPQKIHTKVGLGSTSWRYMCYLKGLYVTWYDCYTQGSRRIFGLWVVICVIYQILSFTGGVTTKCFLAAFLKNLWSETFLENWWQDRPIYPGGCNATCIAARIDVYLSCGTKVRSGKCAFFNDWWELRKIPWFGTLP